MNNPSLIESGISFTPVNFFQLQVDCHFLSTEGGDIFALNRGNCQKYLLPDLSALTAETSYAKIALSWSALGIEVLCLVDQEYRASSYPELSLGDSLEVCIDTRNVKSSGFNTRFCHHFFCLVQPLEGVQAGEITKFRTEDQHELCDSKELQIKSTLRKSSYELNFFIPKSCLQGYDPEQFDHMGFTYRLNRCRGEPQHFSVRSDDYAWEQQPSLWSSVRLVAAESH